MARTFTLATLRSAVRYRADIENSRHHSDAELNTYISASYTWLYDLLINSGQPFFHATQSITTDGTNATFALNAAFYRAVRVRYQASSSSWWRVRQIHPNDIDKQPVTGAWAPYFQIIGDNIEFFPKPPANQVYQVRYIPAPADLTADGTTVDGVSGWEELIVVDAAIKALRKSEEDTSGLERDRQYLLDRIEKAAFDRVMSEPSSLFSEEPADESVDPANWLIWFT